MIWGMESCWATQKAIAAPFDVDVPAISKHLKNIFVTRELDEKHSQKMLSFIT